MRSAGNGTAVGPPPSGDLRECRPTRPRSTFGIGESPHANSLPTKVYDQRSLSGRKSDITASHGLCSVKPLGRCTVPCRTPDAPLPSQPTGGIAVLPAPTSTSSAPATVGWSTTWRRRRREGLRPFCPRCRTQPRGSMPPCYDQSDSRSAPTLPKPSSTPESEAHEASSCSTSTSSNFDRTRADKNREGCAHPWESSRPRGRW